MILPGDLIQITDSAHPWFPCIAVVSEVKPWGAQAFVMVPHNDGTQAGQAYVRLSSSDFESLGVPTIMMPTDIADEREKAIATGEPA